MKEIIIYNTVRKLNDLWAAILFGVLSLTYFTVILYCRWCNIIPVYSTPTKSNLDCNEIGAIRHLFIMFYRNYKFGQEDYKYIKENENLENKYSIDKIEYNESTIQEIMNDEKIREQFSINSHEMVQHIYTTSNIIFIILIIGLVIFVLCLGKKLHVLIPSLLAIHALGCLPPRYDVENIILFGVLFYILVHMSFDLNDRLDTTLLMLKSTLRIIFSGLLFIVPPFLLSVYFMIYQLRLLTNSVIFSTKAKLPLQIFLIFYFIVSLFVVLFTLGLYSVTVFFFLLNLYDFQTILIYTMMNVYYTFGTVCLYSMVFYYREIRRFLSDTLSSLMNSEMTKKGILKIFYTCAMFTLLPILPFLILFTKDSLDFIVCLAFYGKKFKTTNEKNKKIHKNPEFTKLGVFDVNRILLGILIFGTVMIGFIYNDFVVLYKMERFTRVEVLRWLVVGRCLVYSYFTSLVFNSLVGILHYMVIFKNGELKRYDSEIHSIFRSLRITLVVIITFS